MNQNGLHHKLAAILNADVKGYSRLMTDNEEDTVRTIIAYREVFKTLIHEYKGRVVDSPGDNILAEFVSIAGALQCAWDIQQEIKSRNADLPENRRMFFRIGINIGDIIEEEGRIYGDGVNIAARLEGLADQGGICISGAIYDQVKNRLSFQYEYMGRKMVKNIIEPVRVYRVKQVALVMDPNETVTKYSKKKSWLWPVSAVVFIFFVGTVSSFFFSDSKTQNISIVEKVDDFSSGKPSIAVLPFDNMSDDPEQEYFSDGMTEEIITRLSTSPRITVIARNSTFFYKGKRLKIQQIAQELGAEYVVEGSVRKSGNTVRVTAQLIDATTEIHIWAKTYDREFKDIFSLQDDIAQQIVVALNIKSLEAEQDRAWRLPTENLTAYDSLLRGLSHFSQLTKEENSKAKAMFEKAIELDSEYASAYGLLGLAHFMDYAFGSNKNPQTLEQITEFARKAISLDDSSSLAHVLLADVYKNKGQFEQAIYHAERALTLNPNDPSANFSMGKTLNSIGKSKKAVEAIKKAISLDPHYAVYYNTELANAYQNLGQYDEAIVCLKKTLAMNPSWIQANFRLAINYCLAWGITQSKDPSMLDRASKIAEKLAVNDDSSGYGYFALSIINLYKKQYDKALAYAEKLIALAPESADSYALLATSCNSVGRSDEAIEMVEKAMQLNPAIPAWYLNTLATAYAFSGNKIKAVATYKRVFDHNPSHADKFNTHLILAILYVELDQEKDARFEAQEILKIVPNFSLVVWGQRNSIKEQAQIERDMVALRKAGLN